MMKFVGVFVIIPPWMSTRLSDGLDNWNLRSPTSATSSPTDSHPPALSLLFTTTSVPPSISSTTSSGSRVSPRRVRHMTDTQYLDHRRCRMCYRCSQQYNLGHVCSTRTLNVMLVGENSIPTDPLVSDMVEFNEDSIPKEAALQYVQLSPLTSQGFDGPHTMKLIGRVGDYKVLTMINSGTSHCFISDRVATHLGLTIDASASSSMTLGNGLHVSTLGKCCDIPPLFIVTHLPCGFLCVSPWCRGCDFGHFLASPVGQCEGKLATSNHGIYD
ncbi:hypothetical protein C2S51_009434 [Perilla frutescens var. frutescens]|nr:hypothetical protein C2S51_009434 [Perilla frutescens var. frutescens]